MVAACDISGQKLSSPNGADILGGGGDLDAVSYTCPDHTPEYDAATDLLYAFAASGTSCCSCYELAFTRSQLNSDGQQCKESDARNGDVNCILSSIPESQVGRRMLVQVLSSNDAGKESFDLMIPGQGLKTSTYSEQACTTEAGTHLNGPVQFENGPDSFLWAGFNKTAISNALGMSEANLLNQFGAAARNIHSFIDQLYSATGQRKLQEAGQAAGMAKLRSHIYNQLATDMLQYKTRCAEMPASLKPGCEQFKNALDAWGGWLVSGSSVTYHRIQCPARLTAKSQCVPHDDKEYMPATGSPTLDPTSSPSFSPSYSPSYQPSFSPTTAVPTTGTPTTSAPTTPAPTTPAPTTPAPTTGTPTTSPTELAPEQVTTVSIEFNLPTLQPTSMPTSQPTSKVALPEQLLALSALLDNHTSDNNNHTSDNQTSNNHTSETNVTESYAPTYAPTSAAAPNVCSEEGRAALIAGITSSLESKGYNVTNKTIITITVCEIHLHTPAPTPMSYMEMLLKQGRPTPAPTALSFNDLTQLSEQVGSDVHVQYSIHSESAALASEAMKIVSDPSMNKAMQSDILAIASEPAVTELTAGFPPTLGPTIVPTASPTIPEGPAVMVEGSVGQFANYTTCQFGCKGCETGSEEATCAIFTDDMTEACAEVAGYDVNTAYRTSLDEDGNTITDNVMNYCNYMVRAKCGAACSDQLLHQSCEPTCNKFNHNSGEEFGDEAISAATAGKNVLQTWLNMHSLSRSIDSFTEMHCGWWYLLSDKCWCNNICYAQQFEAVDPNLGCCSLDFTKLSVFMGVLFFAIFVVVTGVYQIYYRIYLRKQENVYLDLKPVPVLAINKAFSVTLPVGCGQTEGVELATLKKLGMLEEISSSVNNSFSNLI